MLIRFGYDGDKTRRGKDLPQISQIQAQINADVFGTEKLSAAQPQPNGNGFCSVETGSLKYFMVKERWNRLRRECFIISNTPQPKPDNRQSAKVRLCVNVGLGR